MDAPVPDTISTDDKRIVGRRDRSTWPSCGSAIESPSSRTDVCEAPAPRIAVEASPDPYFRMYNVECCANRSATVGACLASRSITRMGAWSVMVGNRVAVTVTVGSTCVESCAVSRCGHTSDATRRRRRLDLV